MSEDTKEQSVLTGTEEKKEKRVWIWCATIALVIIAAAIVYTCFAYYYMDKIFPKTEINGISCGELTVEQAEANIKEKVEDYTLQLTFRDGSSAEIKGQDIDYQYVSKGNIQQIQQTQNPWKWICYVFNDKEYEFEEAIQFDRSKLLHIFYNLDNVSGKSQISPTDACVSYVDDAFVIVPDEEGNKIKKTELYQLVAEAISASQTELNVAEFPVYEEPTVRQDSDVLAAECEQLNELAAVSITYELPDGERVLDGNEVRKWLNQDEEGCYTITEKELKSAVTSYVAELAGKVNTVGVEREFQSTKRGTLQISGGSYGYKIDQKTEVNQILDEIAGHEIVTREPNYSSVEVTNEANGLGDTYVEMDLSAQHLWYYIDGKLYMESDLVSGTSTVPSRKTPGGIYLLSYKQKNAVLRGPLREDGTYSYESPVTFWMPFNRGIGMHDASWRGTFGGNIYMYSGSHGCINLPYDSAKAIYEKIDKETPIIVYY